MDLDANSQILWRAAKWRHDSFGSLGSITAHDVAVFVAANNGEGVRIKEIFSVLGYSYLRVNQVLKDLEADGLVAIAQSADDRRAKEVRATEKLMRLIDTLSDITVEHNKKLYARWR